MAWRRVGSRESYATIAAAAVGATQVEIVPETAHEDTSHPVTTWGRPTMNTALDDWKRERILARAESKRQIAAIARVGEWVGTYFARRWASR